MNKLPKPKHKYGYSESQVKEIMKKLNIPWKIFEEAFGVNTVAVAENGESILYVCDVERALWKLRHKLGKFHIWD